MKSKTIHKFWTLSALLLMLFAFVSVRSQPLSPPDDAFRQRPILLIENNASPEDAKNYQITIEKDAKPGEPCLTISWKTNPDGSGPADPKIYMVNGYFKIKPYSPTKT
ncbi:uncharacterized protein LOC117784511 [Drosophila innubila]|uniref:uncharacterized protein LOC117784511 n=1 Tax=Drosophila innubila TaxID=198719 RepID=UPI00148C6D42|nr:uncharacterized protein LOC117784511 [Drosophila innubila]